MHVDPADPAPQPAQRCTEGAQPPDSMRSAPTTATSEAARRRSSPGVSIALAPTSTTPSSATGEKPGTLPATPFQHWPRGDGEAHPVRETSGRGLRGVEVCVAVETHHAEVPKTCPGDRPDRGVAVPGEDERELALCDGLPYLPGDQAVQLEGGRHLGRLVGLGVQVHEGRRWPVLGAEQLREPVVPEVVGAAPMRRPRCPAS